VIRVLVAADSAVARAGLESVVASRPSLTVVGSSSAGAELAQQIEALQPDVVLAEPSWRDGDDVLTALHGLNGWGHAAALVILHESSEDGDTASLLRAGVRAVLPRSATAEEIVAAIDAAALGLVVLHDDALGALLPTQRVATRATSTQPAQALTPRETEVLNMLAEGLGNKQTAARLGISEHTVKAHVAAIFGKLGVSSRTEAVTLGARLGLIML
jgi:DNA-binding NarL/FixJ family response regulator